MNRIKRYSFIAGAVGGALALLTLSGWIGYRIAGRPSHDPGATEATTEAPEAPKDADTVTEWTCSMHPQIRMPDNSSKCPICFMDLIPVTEESAGAGKIPEITLSERAQALAGIRTSPVTRQFVENTIRVPGKIAYDETRLKRITAWFPGRIDRLFADYTGIPVQQGDHLAALYSPELLTDQEELIQALGAVERLTDDSAEMVRRSAEKTLQAVRDQLRLKGLTAEQIQDVETSRKAMDQLTIHAPIGGIVVEKHVNEGDYVKTGAPLYAIADVSTVWLMLELYESDLSYVHFGQTLEFEAEAWPGEVFTGRIAFIGPELDPFTRTVPARANIPNPSGRLKPGMFVRATIRSKLTGDGHVADQSLAGKWISPMHPEIIKDAPGLCDVCGMPLVSAESLGYVNESDAATQAPLTVPATAVLYTGKRSVVYVAKDKAAGRFEGREVVIGEQAGDRYLVKSGLEEGEDVVTHGAFKIDSALQILARPSMMSGEPDPTDPEMDHPHDDDQPPPLPKAETPEAFDKQISALFAAYFAIQQSLSQDKAADGAEHWKTFQQAIDQVTPELLDDELQEEWMEAAEDLTAIAESLDEFDAIQAIRLRFAPLSMAMAKVARRFGAGGQTVYQAHCPMAFDNAGADWLTEKAVIENPYFGSVMFACGDIRDTLAGDTGARP